MDTSYQKHLQWTWKGAYTMYLDKKKPRMLTYVEFCVQCLHIQKN